MDMVLDENSNIDDLKTFKNNVKKWKLGNCSFKLYYSYKLNYSIKLISTIKVSFKKKKKLTILRKHFDSTNVACKYCLCTPTFFNLLDL